MTLPLTFTIDWLGRPQTSNAERQAHYHKSAKIRAAWNEAAHQACQIARAPKGLDRIGILIQPIYDKGPLPDTDAIGPTVKGIIDGIVTGKPRKSAPPGYGVVPDDSGKHVAYVCLLAPILDRSAKPGVRVTITPGGSSEEAP